MFHSNFIILHFNENNFYMEKFYSEKHNNFDAVQGIWCTSNIYLYEKTKPSRSACLVLAFLLLNFAALFQHRLSSSSIYTPQQHLINFSTVTSVCLSYSLDVWYLNTVCSQYFSKFCLKTSLEKIITLLITQTE